MRCKSLILFAAAVGITTACESSTEAKITYKANLTGAQENPPNSSAGTGTWTGTLDENNVLTYTMSFSGLGSNVTAAHIHAPAAVAVNANPIVDFDAASVGRILAKGATSGTASGTVTLTAATTITTTINGDSLRKLLNAGLAYVNVHTTLIGSGEIRGQITRQ